LHALIFKISIKIPKHADRTLVDGSFLYTIGTNRARIGFEKREKTVCQNEENLGSGKQ
jgi:hypothetical protein